MDQVVKKVQEKLSAKNKKKLEIKPHQIKQNIWIFVNCLIENPAFDSQTKETLNTRPKDFGSKIELSEKFMKGILESGVVENILRVAEAREVAKSEKTLKFQKKSRVFVNKLDDANDAGNGKKSEGCTIILTEGDSAKTLAMAGIEVIGRDKFGCFPLKGKFLNVREATPAAIRENPEIQNLCKILGLQVGKKYDDLSQLRYGKIMIMTD